MAEKQVFDFLTPAEILAQLGEEGAELSQAALKLRRALDGTNPTPKNEAECREALCEEFGDVVCCIEVFCEANHMDVDAFEEAAEEIARKKYDRWRQRLRDKEGEK